MPELSSVDAWYDYLTGVKDVESVAVGVVRDRREHVVNGDRIFQIGSVTKTFTALALAASGIPVDAPLRDHLPADYPVPGPITLAHLASHLSGLDRLPPGLLTDPDLDPKDPYAHFTEAKLIDALGRTELLSPPGTKYLYSNYGAGVLGRALTDDYAGMIQDRIATPLGLADTAVTLTPAQQARKADGHDPNGQPTPDWHTGALAGAGALYGTVNDLLRYVRAHLGDAPPPLRTATDLVQRPRFTISPVLKVGLGWHMLTLPASRRTAVWHNGGTGGFTGFVAFCPSHGTGVALLANRGGFDLDPYGLAILDAL
jgi:D-alanyl-D-alanine-carboxypeptidase/D-alanyl-D-alanine-endopeptidase